MKKPLVKLTSLAVMLAFSGVSAYAVAEDNDAKSEKLKLDKVTVKGILPEKLEAVPGSFNVIDQKALEERRPVSIKEALNNVPGINIVGEDSMSLNLNIGVRGMNPRRSARTLLMEDGVPIFFAPYGDPSAHFSTPLERVDRIEVVKGSGQILYGPQTMGGMINFVTKPVPRNGFAGRITGMIGNEDFRGTHLNLGTGNERGGIMFDAVNRSGDGVRDHHKFKIEEYTLKGEIDLTENHTLRAKVSTFREGSNYSETGLGLTEWNQDKFQAPTGRNDEFNQKRDTASVQHIWQINDKAKLSTQAYYSDIFRASFRQVHNTTTSGADGEGKDEDNPNDFLGNQYSGYGQLRGMDDTCGVGNDTDRARLSTLSLLNGDINPANCGGRHRPRRYTFYGIEPRLDMQHNLFGINNDLVVGLRLHWEDINRKQYSADGAAGQSLAWAKANGELREAINHQVQSQSFYAQNTFYVNDWSFTPGLRVERYKLNKQIAVADGGVISSDGTINKGDGAGLRYTNSQTKLLPGFGVAWNGIQNTTFFAGVHRGFAPARPDRDLAASGDEDGDVIQRNRTKAEVSTNYEVGVRSRYFKGISVESTLFHTKIDDLIVATAGANGAYRNAGEASMSGLELGGRVDFGTIYDTPHNVYVTGSWTNLFNAKFDKDGIFNRDFEDEIGNFQSGDRLPYAPRNMASLNIGYEHPIGVNVRVGADYVSEQKPTPNQFDAITGHSGTIPSYTLLNASASFRPVGSKLTYFVSGHNLADKEYLASRVDGMQAGRGRLVFGGITIDF